MGRPRSYSDEALIRAVQASTSWRGVLRGLGLAATSSSSIRSVQRHADSLGLDHRHFTGTRRWSDDDLRAAVAEATRWRDVVARLGLADESYKDTLKGHAARLGIDVSHLEPARPLATPSPWTMSPSQTHVRRAGSLIAAAWFTLCGHDVAWPLEPARYDLLVTSDGVTRRVQVKTTTVRTGESWTAWLSSTGKSRRTYDPDEIDDFFVVTGDLDAYVIPVPVVGGLQAIVLSAYSAYRISADVRLPLPSATHTATRGP